VREALRRSERAKKEPPQRRAPGEIPEGHERGGGRGRGLRTRSKHALQGAVPRPGVLGRARGLLYIRTIGALLFATLHRFATGSPFPPRAPRPPRAPADPRAPPRTGLTAVRS